MRAGRPAQDQSEAEVIARAGQPGSIVVATNMAGRGTDISLHESVIAGDSNPYIIYETPDKQVAAMD